MIVLVGRRLKFFWLYLEYFRKAKKIWHLPLKSDVLIFDANGLELLLEYLGPWKPEVLHVRNECINIPILLRSLFRRGKKSLAYTDCFIEKVNPKLMVTFTDNNPKFFSISQQHPSVKTVFIQNGTRSYYGDIFEVLEKSSSEACSLMTVDYMMTHGGNVGREFARYIKGKVIPIGSFKNNRLQATNASLNDIVAFISQWQESGFLLNNVFYSHDSFFSQTDRPIVEFLVKYTDKKNKRFMIIPRNSVGDVGRKSEEAYFRELIGNNVVFLEPEGAYGSYKALDIAGVAVGVDSTLIYEAIARGSKAAIFSTRSGVLGLGSFTYGWPNENLDEGPFWTNRSDPKAFERIMDYLFQINDQQWRVELNKHSFDQVMPYDAGNSILQMILAKELGSKPTIKHIDKL